MDGDYQVMQGTKAIRVMVLTQLCQYVLVSARVGINVNKDYTICSYWSYVFEIATIA